MEKKPAPKLNTVMTLKLASRTGCLWRYLRLLVFFGLVAGVLIALGEEAIHRWEGLSSDIPYPYNWVIGGIISLIMMAAGFVMPMLKRYVDDVKMNFWLYYIFYELYVFSFLIIIFGGVAYFFSLITVCDGLTYYLFLIGALGIFTASCLLAMRGGLKKRKKSATQRKKPPVNADN